MSKCHVFLLYIGSSAVNLFLFVKKSLKSESRWSLYCFPQCRVWDATDSDDKQGDKAQLTFSYCTEEAIKSLLFLSQTARLGFMSQYRRLCSLSGLRSTLYLFAVVFPCGKMSIHWTHLKLFIPTACPIKVWPWTKTALNRDRSRCCPTTI